ncbi:hypothetical protein DFH27DRAFT_609867 [Peziza echinospora]|nr:hypothetical protein DFH27DRAFT_609867 [Peziza echinospora]
MTLRLASAQPHRLTFEPYKIQYQTYPWVDPDHQEKDGPFLPKTGPTGNSRLNYLLYCETTGTNELPGADERFLNPPDFGAFYMSRRNFFENYLLKKLKALNWALEPTLTKVTARLDNLDLPTVVWETDLRIRDRRSRAEDDAYYAFKQDAGSTTSWTFCSSSDPPRDADNIGTGGWSAKAAAKANCSCKNTVSFTPGTDIITVTGYPHVYTSFEWWDFHMFAKDEDMNQDLQIASMFDGPHLTFIKEDLKGLGALTEYTKKAIPIAIQNLVSLRNELINDRVEQNGLCLPARGVFFFKNPTLSLQGDLMCSLGYKDTPSAEYFKEDRKLEIDDSEGAKVRKGVEVETVVNLPPAPGSQQVDR